MFPAALTLPTLPLPIVRRSATGGVLHQPGATPATLLSLHTLQGRRVRLAAHEFLDLAGLPAADYLFRVQRPNDEAYVLLVHLD